MHAASPTPWPGYITALEPDVSESPVVAVLPDNILVQMPAAGLAEDKATWSGHWSGWASDARRCDVKMVVESVRIDGATFVYSIASASAACVAERIEATFNSGELRGVLASGAQLALRMRPDGVVELVASVNGGVRYAGVLSNQPLPGRSVERIATKLVENGQPVALEVVIYKPPGAGPFPTVMFNHGSTGNGDNPTLFTSTWTSPALAGFFTQRGWMVAFPQRRGRCKSDGLYDEGFALDRSGYSSQPERSLPGLARAIIDIDAAADYLAGRHDVDAKRMLLGGVSRGGIASIACAGERPHRFVGVINFVGGWVEGESLYADAINGTIARRGGRFAKPTLWLYGENDPFYSISHSRKNFEAFEAAGGTGTFRVFTLEDGQSGHGLASLPEHWQNAVRDYLEQLPCS
jgi:dienelactone hydrolase